MRVLICGDRNWDNKEVIRQNIPEETEVIIEGDAFGADGIAGELADELGILKLVYPAKWNQYGKKAGPIRNTQMLVEGRPDTILAFHNDIDVSVGTKDMIKQGRKANKLVILYSEEGEVNRWEPTKSMFDDA